MIDERYVKQINRAIAGIARGRSRSLETLFSLTKKRLLVVAKCHLYDKTKTEDVLSESYYKVVKNAKSFDRGKNGYNWLYEIVKNTALNQNAKDKIRETLPLEERALPSYDAIDEIFHNVLLEQANSGLTEEEKTMIYEYFFEGRSLQELAEKLKKPKTTVYDGLQKILDKMRKNLGLPEQKKKKTVYRNEEGDEEKRD